MLLSREGQKGRVSRGGRKELGEVEGVVAVTWIYYIKKESISNKRKKSKQKQARGSNSERHPAMASARPSPQVLALVKFLS